MACISAVWLLVQIFGLLSWMLEQDFQDKCTSYPSCFSIRLFLRSWYNSLLSLKTDILQGHYLLNTNYITGVDHGTMGTEVLYQCCCWFRQRQCFGGHVKRYPCSKFIIWISVRRKHSNDKIQIRCGGNL